MPRHHARAPEGGFGCCDAMLLDALPHDGNSLSLDACDPYMPRICHVPRIAYDFASGWKVSAGLRRSIND
jgi:hypothetical protein